MCIRDRCNTEYDASMPNVEVAFPRVTVRNGLGEYLSQMGMTQPVSYTHLDVYKRQPDP